MTEGELKTLLESYGYVVMNLSPSEPGDLIVLYPEIFIIEVKSTTKSKFYFDDRSRKQLAALTEIHDKTIINIVYFIKFLRKGWYFIEMPDGRPLSPEDMILFKKI